MIADPMATNAVIELNRIGDGAKDFPDDGHCEGRSLDPFAGMSASLLTFAVGSEVQALLAWV